jgi:hypothetical protein
LEIARAFEVDLHNLYKSEREAIAPVANSFVEAVKLFWQRIQA